MNNPIGISPTVDFAFKVLLGNSAHPEITIHFLNAILGKQTRIDSVEFLNPTIDREMEEDKLITLDILANDNHGRSLIIEMQTTLPTGMAQRLVYYNARLYADQIKVGDSYSNLCPAITICVLTQSMFPKLKKLLLKFLLREEAGEILTDDFQIYLLELEKLRSRNKLSAKPGKMKLSLLEWWGCFLRYADQFTIEEIEQIFPDKIFVEAGKVLEMISKTPDQKRLYEARMKFKADQAGQIDYARREGEKIGLQKGIAKGKRLGIQEGIQEGQVRGVLIGKIVLLQQILGLKQAKEAELSKLSDRELHQMIGKLQRKLAEQN